MILLFLTTCKKLSCFDIVIYDRAFTLIKKTNLHVYICSEKRIYETIRVKCASSQKARSGVTSRQLAAHTLQGDLIYVRCGFNKKKILRVQDGPFYIVSDILN